MYDAIKIARYVIRYEASRNRSVSNLRLQKLLYFIQAQFLFSIHTPCFSDRIEAWDFGPVVPNVYREYKMFGGARIPESIAEGDFGIEDEDKYVINLILEECAQYSTTSLVSLTHDQKPWREAHQNPFDKTISNQSIRDFFGG
ncbi:MAG: DUF4065 domain-containing protein [Clostridia bacterium]|nr:DUF4065 domain-containing protein [Clostridia bacterium]